MINRLRYVLDMIEADLFGHESWLILGVEQHKGYYWAAIGDCSNRCPDLDDLKVSLEPAKTFKAKSFEELISELDKSCRERKRRISQALGETVKKEICPKCGLNHAEEAELDVKARLEREEEARRGGLSRHD